MNTVNKKAHVRQAVAYYRVSSQKQGRSGLGLEAQREGVTWFCRKNGYRLVTEMNEVRSTRKDRPVLGEAIRRCAKDEATLVVSSLDRLGRDVAEVAGTIKSKAEIVVISHPHADRLMLHIMAAFAEHERERISINTKAALAAAKRRGVKLGANGKALALRNKRQAQDFALKMAPVILRLSARGVTTVRGIARELNRWRVPTFTGSGRWHPATVHALLGRIARQPDFDQNLNHQTSTHHGKEK